MAVAADVTRGREVERLLAAAPDTLDAVIHCAGFGHCKSIDELDEAEWRSCLDIAVTAAFLAAKPALPKLRAPRPEVVVKRLAPFERWDRVIAILHQSHP